MLIDAGEVSAHFARIILLGQVKFLTGGIVHELRKGAEPVRL